MKKEKGRGNDAESVSTDGAGVCSLEPTPGATPTMRQLLEKYQRLCTKYEALVHKFEDVSHADLSVFQLGWWALQTSASALALVRGGTIVLSNNRWQDLDAEPTGVARWEAIDERDGPLRCYTSLRDLALREARPLLESDATASKVSRYRRSGSPQVVEVRLERLGGHGVVALFAHDVTDQARSEVELRKAREALHHRDRMQVIGEVASGLAHDLNNALNVMRLRLELLRRQPAENLARSGQLEAFAQIVDDAAARVARMHDLSRPQHESPFELIELRKVVADAVAMGRTELEQPPTVAGPRIRLAVEVPELPPVRANRAEVQHVFVNLLLNARDAMPQGGTIAIGGRRDGDAAVISVTDGGTGIPPENLERIFESFFTTKGARGTGLGLAMARGAMARLGGSIQARNVPGGAQLVLRFPLAVPAAAAAAAVSPRSPSRTIQRQLRVLLVDDDADCLEVTQAVLQHEGLTVDVAASGAEALAKLQAQPYHLLLCDVGMPEMSGWEVAHQARRDGPEMPIYMVTGWAHELAGDDPRRDGVDGVLAKPLDLEELRAAVARIGAPVPSDELGRTSSVRYQVANPPLRPTTNDAVPHD